MIRYGKELIIYALLAMLTTVSSAAPVNISTQDGLTLSLSWDGQPVGVSIDGKPLPMLATSGGFTFREVLTGGPNLVKNPGFEYGTTRPVNWSIVEINGSTPVWDTISHSGKKSVKISFYGEEIRSGYYKSDLIEVQPLQSYTLSAWMKVNGIAGTNGPAVRVVELDSNEKWLRQTNLVFGNDIDNWTQKQITFSTGNNTRWVYVFANYWNGHGTFWVDDIQLTKVYGPVTNLTGTVVRKWDGSVIHTASASNLGFNFTYIPRERYIEIQAVVANRLGTERQVQLTFSLPINATGWRWNGNTSMSRKIVPKTQYKSPVNPFAYPFSSIDDGTDRGISLAMPVIQHTNESFSYSTSEGYTTESVTLQIGAGKTAEFDLIFYSTDTIGFGSALGKYDDITIMQISPTNGSFNSTEHKKIIHQSEEDFRAGTSINVEVLKDGIIALKRKNLLNNPSFEVDDYFSRYNLDGFAEDWFVWNPSGGKYTTQLDNTAFAAGSKSQKITFYPNSNKSLYLMQKFTDIKYRNNFVFSAFVKIENPEKSAVTSWIEFWKNSTYLGSYKSNSTSSIYFIRKSVYGEVPSGANMLKVMIELEPKFKGAEGTMWVDAAQLEVGVNPTNYGDSYDTTEGEYTSAPIDLGGQTTPYKLDWTTSVKAKGKISLQLRSANTQGELVSAQWYGPTGNRDYYTHNQSEWSINKVHYGSRWVQYKINFSTTDTFYSPTLHDLTIEYGASVPQVNWINVLDINGKQKYAFMPGETAYFKVEALDFKGNEDLRNVNITVFNTSNKIVSSGRMCIADAISNVKRNYIYQYRFPTYAVLGSWKVVVTAKNKDGKIYTQNSILEVKKVYSSSPNKMKIGVMAADIGFRDYKNYNKTIEMLSKNAGLDIWKLSVSWDLLEPENDVFDDEYIDSILSVMNAAQKNGAKIQIGLQPTYWPVWANNGNWENYEKYNYQPTSRVAGAWTRLADKIKNHPALDSYLISSEENYVTGPDIYLRAQNLISSSIRTVDNNLSHRIVVRPNTVTSYTRSRISLDGTFDFDYGTTAYPTSWAWWLESYESPVSNTSYLRMSVLRNSPVAYGGAGGIGEIGFYKVDNDAFGDYQKLQGYKRAMGIAYDQGDEEFMIIGSKGLPFENPSLYFPKIIGYRNNLTKQQRLNYFNAKVLLDGDDWLYNDPDVGNSSKLNMDTQPFVGLIKTLDEEGYSWFYTHPNVEYLQNINYNVTIKTSELKGKNQTQQKEIVLRKLSNVRPSGGTYPWTN